MHLFANDGISEGSIGMSSTLQVMGMLILRLVDGNGVVRNCTEKDGMIEGCIVLFVWHILHHTPYLSPQSSP